VLREDSAAWDARYNSLRAQRLMHDKEEGDGDPAAEESNPTAPVTTMPRPLAGVP